MGKGTRWGSRLETGKQHFLPPHGDPHPLTFGRFLARPGKRLGTISATRRAPDSKYQWTPQQARAGAAGFCSRGSRLGYCIVPKQPDPGFHLPLLPPPPPQMSSFRILISCCPGATPRAGLHLTPCAYPRPHPGLHPPPTAPPRAQVWFQRRASSRLGCGDYRRWAGEHLGCRFRPTSQVWGAGSRKSQVRRTGGSLSAGQLMRPSCFWVRCTLSRA